jgi:hypothetical protein
VNIIRAATSGGTDYLSFLVPIILALLGSGALVAFFRARPEGSKIIVDAAQGAVVVQSGVIEDLRDQLTEARKQLAEFHELQAEVGRLRREVRTLEHDNEMLTLKNEGLERRIQILENRRSEAP